MDWALLLGPVATGATGVFEDVVPIAIPVLILFVGLSIGLTVFRKFGLKR